jgi:hypothetical protein
MKKILLIAILFIISCKAPKFIMGMPEAEFTRNNPRAELISAKNGWDIYRQINYPFGAPPKYKFFYFKDGVLKQMDEGHKRPDLTIEATIHND